MLVPVPAGTPKAAPNGSTIPFGKGSAVVKVRCCRNACGLIGLRESKRASGKDTLRCGQGEQAEATADNGRRIWGNRRIQRAALRF